jgi:hypothetical protein
MLTAGSGRQIQLPALAERNRPRIRQLEIVLFLPYSLHHGGERRRRSVVGHRLVRLICVNERVWRCRPGESGLNTRRREQRLFADVGRHDKNLAGPCRNQLVRVLCI